MFFLSALSFGLASGLKPGPLGVLVIQQTLSRGLPAGVRTSLAPLITDGPIIIAALWLLSQFKTIDLFVAALSLVGGAYLLWLSAKMLRINSISLSAQLRSGSSLVTALPCSAIRQSCDIPGPYSAGSSSCEVAGEQVSVAARDESAPWTPSIGLVMLAGRVYGRCAMRRLTNDRLDRF
jgi:hypothetical protein